jgi:glucose/arabinose dehydrogenase
MRHCFVFALVFTTCAVAMSAKTSIAAITGLERVASGLSAPIYVTHAPGDRERLFIVQRGGGIRILNLTTGTLQTTPFLSITDVNSQGEGGLLGMAFHPDYSTPDTPGFGKFYVNVTVNNPTPEVFEGANSPFSTLVREYTVSSNPNVANNSPDTIMKITQPQDNHNGGWIGFSPVNGYLYIPTGDGGGGGDSGSGHTPGTGNAQDITNNLLGKILRIDVDGDDYPDDPLRDYAIPTDNPYVGVTGDDEIWATGLRNPFRDSFDRLTGDLWLGDVGQGSREEIDRQPANAPGGENFGWRLCEGTNCASPPAKYRGPVYDYGRPIDDPLPLDPAITATNQMRGKTVIGGYVYRGPDPSFQGQYFFLDRDGGTAGVNYWRFNPDNPVASVQNIDTIMTPNVGSAGGPVSMGEDANGNLYITYFSGEVYRIATNELIDGDYNADGVVDNSDFEVWQANFGATTGLGLAADGNNDNEVNAADFTVWRDNFGNSAQAPGAGGGSVAVPEPTALVVVATAFGATLLCRRQRKNLQ